jgi:hypothetical protein
VEIPIESCKLGSLSNVSKNLCSSTGEVPGFDLKSDAKLLYDL